MNDYLMKTLEIVIGKLSKNKIRSLYDYKIMSKENKN